MDIPLLFTNSSLIGVQIRMALREFEDAIGVFVPSDTIGIPFLRWMDLGGHVKSMKKASKKMDDILQNWLEEHKRKRNKGDLNTEKQDFMDAMISMLDGTSSEDLSCFSADTINKATCIGAAIIYILSVSAIGGRKMHIDAAELQQEVSLLLGGTDAQTVTLTWALSLLLNNPLQFQKVMAELDEHIGRNRLVQESDITNLVYLQAVIKETLRLYPAAPLAFPHESLEDCVVGGYRVPKGTHLLLNLHKIQRDHNIWSDPDEFQPERFLTTHKDVDVRGQHFELIPFGSGRRICPGISFGLNVVQFTLASLLQCFEIAKPSDDPIDMTVGLSNTLKATPLEVVVAPRLSAHLYE